MESIDSAEVVATPTMQAPEPPRRVCVMIRLSAGDGKNFDLTSERIFHEDFPVGFDLDGKFRARVGEALSVVLGPQDPQLSGEKNG